MTARAAVHGSLWYEDPWYRLAWLALPQAGTVLLANLLFALVAQGEWGRPATGSRQRAAELEILRDRAGGEGDAAALNQLAAGAKAGEIDAATRLATLYDPLVAGRFPRKTVPSDRGAQPSFTGPAAMPGIPPPWRASPTCCSRISTRATTGHGDAAWPRPGSTIRRRRGTCSAGRSAWPRSSPAASSMPRAAFPRIRGGPATSSSTHSG